MQTPPFLIKQLKPTRFLGLLLLGTLLTAALLPAKSPQHTVESRGTPDRQFRLFVGVDIKIFHEDDFGVVTDFNDSVAQIDGSKEATVDVRNASRVRFEPTTKVGRAPITIGKIETTRAFSARNDPRRQWASRQAQVQAYQNEQQAQQVGNLSTAAQYAGNGIASQDANGNTFLNPAIAKADSQLAAFKADTVALTDNQFYAERGREAAATDGAQDALVVEAMMSSPQLISDAYVVGIARVQKEGVQNDIIFFDDLGELGPEPRKVTVRKDGLPADLEVLKVSLHVFREGQELVSDQSDKQFALTREEALEYLTLAHTSSHRGQTLAAEPAWSLAPAELFAAKHPDQFDYALRVSIDDRGRVAAIDENAILPDHIRTIVNDLVFIPALANGVAIASDVSFNLNDFFR
jgi:hypothetical protein